MNRFVKRLTIMLWTAAIAAAAGPKDVRAVLDAQVAAWNRGDIPGFMQTYAADTTFISKNIHRGSKQVQERYETTYSNKEKMGTLSFEDIEIKMLGPDHAYAIGHWRLSRSAAGGGDAGGTFSLVLEKRPAGWQIVLDHTH